MPILAPFPAPARADINLTASALRIHAAVGTLSADTMTGTLTAPTTTGALR